MRGKSKSRDYGGNTCLRTVRFRIHGLRRQYGNGGTPADAGTAASAPEGTDAVKARRPAEWDGGTCSRA